MFSLFILLTLARCGAGDPSVPTAPGAGGTGRLAYVGGDGNVYVTTADGSQTIAVTDDATAPPEGQGRSYHRVAWSPEGWLAFASVSRYQDRARSQLYVTESPGEPARVVGESDAHFVIYIHWSPAPCPQGAGCQSLAYLIQEGQAVGLRSVEIDRDRVTNQLLDAGSPFYFSWSPDGRQMLWHTGSARRFDPQARLALYDVAGDRVRELPQQPGRFHAPAWSPRGERWLGVFDEGEGDRLQVVQDDRAAAPIVATQGPITFVWSPDGKKIAYAVRKDSVELFYRWIYVLDLDSGETRQVTADGFRIFGFFWSPDGRRLGYLTRLDLPDSVWMQWRVRDLVRDEDRGFAAFHPSPQMRYVISSFNQYAQSHRFWSPDGRYLVYADRDRDRVDRVWLVDTQAPKGSDPLLIDEGTIGFWSWQ